jgi:hypothetical protein
MEANGGRRSLGIAARLLGIAKRAAGYSTGRREAILFLER